MPMESADDEEDFGDIIPGSTAWQLKELGYEWADDDELVVWLAHKLDRHAASIQSFHKRWQDEG